MRLVSIIMPVVRPASAAKAMSLARKHAGVDDFEILAEVDFARIGAPKMVKQLVDRSNGDLVCFIGDDTRPRRNWLAAALVAMSKLPDGWGLIGLNDRTGRDLPTHWLADKRLLPLIGGEFFHTGYRHCYCDNELHERCIALGRYRYAYQSIVDHDHPLLRGRPVTGEYARIYSKEWMTQDRDLYRQRKWMWANGN